MRLRTVRFATDADRPFLVTRDSDVKAPILDAKIGQRQIYVVEDKGQVVGWARYYLLWDIVPFLTLIYILDGHRRKGHGTAVMAFWEQDMAAHGHRYLMTSTQADEQAQHFYRALGFRDCGALFFPLQVPAELFLVKETGAQAHR